MILTKSGKEFMVTGDGSLYDTSDKMPSNHVLIRENYCYHRLEFETLNDVKASLRAGEFAWPGGYRLAFITSDGAILSFGAVKDEWHGVVWDWINDASTGWRVIGLVNVDDMEDIVYCDHTNELLNDPEPDH